MPRLLSRLFLAALLVAVLDGGAPNVSAQTVSDGKPAAPVPQAAGVDLASYRVGPEDLLEISVWREEALKKEALVRPDGSISYPLIGEIQAAGKTVTQLREEVTRRLDKFIPDAVVSVTVLKTGSQRIYVLGKVVKPGEFPVGRSVDVLQALSMAGGFTQFADVNGIRIMRRDGEKQLVLPFEYGRVVRGERLDQNVPLRAGDVVVVP